MLLTGSLKLDLALSSSYTVKRGEKSFPDVFHMMKLSRSLFKFSSVALPSLSCACFIYVRIAGSGDLCFSGSIKSFIFF